MDVDTLANHISKMGKSYFDSACKIVLCDVFNLAAINVDGKGDGGSDFTSFSKSGKRMSVGYQITTQKTDLKRKAYKDALKALEKLNVNSFYFITNYNLDEVETLKIQNRISSELGISTTCLTPRHLAGLILDANLLNKLLDECNYPLPRDANTSYDYREMALHSYTLLSDDAAKMKSNIYDDTILFIISNESPIGEDELIEKVKEFLDLGDQKSDQIKRRIGALFGNKKLIWTVDKRIELSPEAFQDLKNRKSLYESELSSLSSAQVELMINDYNCQWTEEDSKKVAIWIANISIIEKVNSLKELKANIVSNPIFDIENNGIEKLRNFLKQDKKLDRAFVDDAVKKLLEIASIHPLITKIARASVYLALEGRDPISSAKALGAMRWSDINILVEPTIAIPYTCSQLYKGSVNKYFDLSIRSVKEAQNLGASLYIPYFYINECAGHLLRARKYHGIEFDEQELVYSSNAFVANYYALKNQGVKVPDSFLNYLCTYSPSVKTERVDQRQWIRAVMIDIQSILTKAKVNFIDVPFYAAGDCKDFEIDYTHTLQELGIVKKPILINHDIYALQFANDKITKDGEHWIILTFDNTMISVSKGNIFQGWITNPIKFLDFAECTKPLQESRLISLVHSFATFSERTLAAGARIIDRIVTFAAPEMQNWEFKEQIQKFKEEVIKSTNLDKTDYIIQIEKQTDEFLKKHGIELKEDIEISDT